MFKNAVILSGGHGTRMLPLTKITPKALIKVDGIPLIYNSINLLKEYDIDTYVTYNYQCLTLFNDLYDKVKGFINTINQDNSYFLFNSFVKYLDEPIIIIPCDIVTKIDLKELFKNYIKLDSPITMLVSTNPVDGISGDYITYDNNNLVKSLSRTEETDRYCSGIQIINPKKLNNLLENKNNFYDVWNFLIETKNIKISDLIPTTWSSYDDIKQINKITND